VALAMWVPHLMEFNRLLCAAVGVSKCTLVTYLHAYENLLGSLARAILFYVSQCSIQRSHGPISISWCYLVRMLRYHPFDAPCAPVTLRSSTYFICSAIYSRLFVTALYNSTWSLYWWRPCIFVFRCS